MKLNRSILFLVLLITVFMLNLATAGAAQNIGELNPVQKIDITGSPYQGPENAPIVLVTFDDFQ